LENFASYTFVAQGTPYELLEKIAYLLGKDGLGNAVSFLLCLDSD